MPILLIAGSSSRCFLPSDHPISVHRSFLLPDHSSVIGPSAYSPPVITPGMQPLLRGCLLGTPRSTAGIPSHREFLAEPRAFTPVPRVFPSRAFSCFSVTSLLRSVLVGRYSFEEYQFRNFCPRRSIDLYVFSAIKNSGSLEFSSVTRGPNSHVSMFLF